MAQYDGSITLSTEVDTTGIKKGIGTVKSMLAKLGAAAAAAFGIRQLIQFGKEAVNLASDMEEVQNVVNVAFGSMSDKAEAFANTAIDTYGISKLVAKRTSSTYMAMAKGMGLAVDTAADMSFALTGLSADMASFYNISQEAADVALKSVFTGETETLKQYGIVMTQVNLEEFARQNGIKKSIQKMTQQEQVLLRYKYIMQQTALAQGDFARTQDSWANQTRILNEQWKEMQAAFGETFKTAATAVLPVINKMIAGLTVVANITRQATINLAAMFGKKIEASTSNVAKSTSAASDGIEDVGEATKDANKEIERSLAGFDELNILSQETADSGDDIAKEFENSFKADSPDVGETNFDTSTITDEVRNAVAIIAGIGGTLFIALGTVLIFSGHIVTGLGVLLLGIALVAVSSGMIAGMSSEEIKAKVLEITAIGGALFIALGVILIFSGNLAWGIGLIIAGVVDEIAVATISNFSSDSIKARISEISDIASKAFIAIGLILLCFGQMGWGVGFIIAGAALIVQRAVIGILNSKDILNTISIITEAAGLIMISIGLILLFFGQFAWGIGFVIVGAASYVTAAVINKFQTGGITAMVNEIEKYASCALLALGVICLYFGQIPIAIGLIAAGAILYAKQAVLGNNPSEETKAMLCEIQAIAAGTLLAIGVILLFLGQIPWGIGLIIAGVVLMATQIATTAFETDNIKAKIIEINTIIGGALAAIGLILLCFGVIPLGLAFLVAGAGMFVTTISIDTEATLKALKDAWSSITGWWEQKVAPWINKAKETLKNIFDFGESDTMGFSYYDGYSYSYDSYSLFSSDIPALARGAVIPPNKEFLAVLGDQKSGTNIEAPLDTITEAVRNALGTSDFGGNQTVVLKIGEQEMGRLAYKLSNKEINRIGVKFGG